MNQSCMKVLNTFALYVVFLPCTLVWAIGWMWFGVNQAQTALKIPAYETTIGVIEDISLEYRAGSRRRYRTSLESWSSAIVYTYKVDNVVYIGRHLSGAWLSDQDTALAAAQREFTLGQEIAIYYDSDQPARSVLNRERSRDSALYWFVVSVGLTLAGAIVWIGLWVSGRRWNRQRGAHKPPDELHASLA